MVKTHSLLKIVAVVSLAAEAAAVAAMFWHADTKLRVH